MGYRVKVQAGLNGAPRIKILYEWFENNVRKTRAVKRHEWGSLGFNERMTPEEAKARMRALNELDRLDGREKRRTKILSRIEDETSAHNAYLGTLLVDEFERDHLMVNATAKVSSNWRAAKKIIAEVRIRIEDWEERKQTFYAAFAKYGFSTSYVAKLIPLMNRWAKFVAKRNKVFFDPLPIPRGRDATRLSDAARKKPVKRGNRKSAPLTPEMLESKKSTLRPVHYNWLYLSVWFGLRPNEIEGLREDGRYRVETIDETPILWVYQPKLASLEEDERWKPIPCLYPEQRRGLVIVQAGQFKRPSKKVFESRFGPKVTGYGGRNNFTSLMRQRGHSIEDYHVWMGHKSIQRTFTSYVDKLTAVIRKRAS